MQKTKEKVIILKKIKYGESDLILQSLTPNGSKISFIARGALKSRKRFGGGVLEPTHYLQVVIRTQAPKLAVVEEAQVLEDFAQLRSDYDRLTLALEILEMISRVAQEGDQHGENLFNLLGNALRTLEKAHNLQLFKIAFMLKLLHQQGVLMTEGWMRPLLQLPLNQFENLEPEVIKDIVPRGLWLEKQTQEYLKSADHAGA